MFSANSPANMTRPAFCGFLSEPHDFRKEAGSFALPVSAKRAESGKYFLVPFEFLPLEQKKTTNNDLGRAADEVPFALQGTDTGS